MGSHTSELETGEVAKDKTLMPILSCRQKEKEMKCRICGCTDDQACPGGCYWVDDDLCSRCDETIEAISRWKIYRWKRYGRGDAGEQLEDQVDAGEQLEDQVDAGEQLEDQVE
jgi:hypothetical protein